MTGRLRPAMLAALTVAALSHPSEAAPDRPEATGHSESTVAVTLGDEQIVFRVADPRADTLHIEVFDATTGHLIFDSGRTGATELTVPLAPDVSRRELLYLIKTWDADGRLVISQIAGSRGDAGAPDAAGPGPIATIDFDTIPDGTILGAADGIGLLGNVGIGTSTPASRLHLFDEGAVDVNIQANDAPFEPSVTFSTTLALWKIYRPGHSNQLIFRNLFAVPGPPAGDLMILDSTGRVGIGTVPGVRLHVADGDAAITASGETGLILTSPDGNCWRLAVANTGALTTASVACP